MNSISPVCLASPANTSLKSERFYERAGEPTSERLQGARRSSETRLVPHPANRGVTGRDRSDKVLLTWFGFGRRRVENSSTCRRVVVKQQRSRAGRRRPNNPSGSGEADGKWHVARWSLGPFVLEGGGRVQLGRLGQAPAGLHLLQPLVQVAVVGLQLLDLVQRSPQLWDQTQRAKLEPAAEPWVRTVTRTPCLSLQLAFLRLQLVLHLLRVLRCRLVSRHVALQSGHLQRNRSEPHRTTHTCPRFSHLVTLQPQTNQSSVAFYLYNIWQRNI